MFLLILPNVSFAILGALILSAIVCRTLVSTTVTGTLTTLQRRTKSLPNIISLHCLISMDKHFQIDVVDKEGTSISKDDTQT